jgi:ribosomal protein L16 Arg81 hydroxylase
MIDLGMTRAEFRETYFEQAPLLRRACLDPSAFGWRTIDQALDLQDPTRELIKVLRGGRLAPETYVEEYMDIGIRRRRIVKERLYAELEAGATLVLNRMELVSPLVRDVCMEVGRLIGAQTTCNTYASFGPQPGTGVHWDTHDVFVVQVKGRKHWRIYEPTHALPISSQTSNDRTDDVPETPALDVILEAGDALYVPRGWWHRASPTEGCDTIHLTVAIHAPLVLDLLVWACAAVLPNLVEVRHSLLGSPNDSERLHQAVAAAADALRHPATLQAFYARSRARERVVSPFAIEEVLERGGGGWPTGTRFRLNARHAAGGEYELAMNGQPRVFTGARKAVVDALARAPSLDLEALEAACPALGRSVIVEALGQLQREDIVQTAVVSGSSPRSAQAA